MKEEESSLLDWEDFKLQKSRSQIGKKREPRKRKSQDVMT